MTEVFIIQNRDQTYLTKQGEWVSGDAAASLFRSPHKDEAVNMKVEQSVRNPQLRLTIVTAQLNDKGSLHLPESNQKPNIDSATEVLFNNQQQQLTDSEPALSTDESEDTL